MDIQIKKSDEFERWQDAYDHLVELYQITNESVLGMGNAIKMSNNGLVDYVNDNEKRYEALKKLGIGNNDGLVNFMTQVNSSFTEFSNKMIELNNLFAAHTKLLDTLGKGLKAAIDEITEIKKNKN
jgi:hypothetical protein